MRKFQAKKSSLKTMGGVIFALLALVILFSPNTPFEFLSRAITTSIGFVGFWLVLPFIIAISAFLILKLNAPNIHGTKVFIGIGLIILALMIILSLGDSRYSFTEASKVTTGFNMPDYDVTIYAKWLFDDEALNNVTSDIGMSYKYTDSGKDVVSTKGVNDEATKYELVKDTSKLKAGDEILIVGIENDAYYALAPWKSGDGNCKRNDVALSGDGTIETNVASLTLGGSSGAWTLNDGTYYLYASGGTGSNQLKGTTSEPDNTGKWTISCDENGVATIKCIDSETTRNWLRHNAASDLFSCYAETSSQQDVYIYRKADNRFTDVNFKFNFKNNGLADYINDYSEIYNDIGMLVTYTDLDGKTEKEMYFSFIPDTNGYYWIKEENLDNKKKELRKLISDKRFIFFLTLSGCVNCDLNIKCVY